MAIKKPDQTIHITLTLNKRDKKSGRLKCVDRETRTVQDIAPKEIWDWISKGEISKREAHPINQG